MRALTIRVKRRFGRKNWPMEYEWPDYSPDASGDERVFRMSAEIAGWWTATRSSAMAGGEAES